MTARQQIRRMRPDAYDPWQHNQDVRTRKQFKRLGQAARKAAAGMRKFGAAIAAFGAAIRQVRQ